MTLETWQENGWLRPHATSKQEVRGILDLVERDLADASSVDISKDWRFNIAYNAGLQLAALVLYAAGYRAGRGESKHYRIIQALPLVMGSRFSAMRDYLDSCRRKRNISEYDAAGTISQKETEDLLETVSEFKVEVEAWLRQNRPDIFP
ncbi:MAG: hypothetical protein JW821_13045 [Deltaproteobacteria bacterium]|nr:hypothetical protein [Deltaproteobacteria bacterium]